MRFILTLAVVLFGLVACTEPTTELPDDMTAYTYKTADGEDVISYACVNGASAAETQKRSASAHGFFQAERSATVDRLVRQMERNPNMSQSQVEAQIKSEVEATLTTMFDRYQCVVLDIRDA